MVMYTITPECRRVTLHLNGEDCGSFSHPLVREFVKSFLGQERNQDQCFFCPVNGPDIRLRKTQYKQILRDLVRVVMTDDPC